MTSIDRRRDQPILREVLENTVFNVVLVIVGHCACYLIVVLPPHGGWNARPGWMQHASVRIGFPVVGLTLIGAGAFLAIAALKQRKVIGIQEVAEGLLTSGRYRYFRHPIYTGILWFTLGLALLTRNPDGLLMFLPILIWLLVGTMLEEKLDMCMRYPEEYRKYRQTARMFGPIWLWVTLIAFLAVLIGAALAASRSGKSPGVGRDAGRVGDARESAARRGADDDDDPDHLDVPEQRMVLIELYRQLRPTLVLTHSANDHHSDHRVASALAATWPCACYATFDRNGTAGGHERDMLNDVKTKPQAIVKTEAVLLQPVRLREGRRGLSWRAT